MQGGLQEELLGNVADVRLYTSALDSAGVGCVLSEAPYGLAFTPPRICRQPEVQVSVVISTDVSGAC